MTYYIMTCLWVFFQFKGFFAQQNQEELDYSALLDDEENLDASPSEPVELILPRVQPGRFSKFISLATWHFEISD